MSTCPIENRLYFLSHSSDCPEVFFELLGQSPDLTQGYVFRSVEVKQLAFRIDGVFLPQPDAPDQTVWFVEVPFQKDPHFYHRFFAEIFSFSSSIPKQPTGRQLYCLPDVLLSLNRLSFFVRCWKAAKFSGFI